MFWAMVVLIIAMMIMALPTICGFLISLLYLILGGIVFFFVFRFLVETLGTGMVLILPILLGYIIFS